MVKIIKTMQMFPHPYLLNIPNRFLQTESVNFCATPSGSQKREIEGCGKGAEIGWLARHPP